MKYAFPSLFLSFMFVHIFTNWSEAKNETIVEVPYKNDQSVWEWSWANQSWSTKNDQEGKVLFHVCDITSPSEPNKWIRSNMFPTGDAKRIDVTINYAVIKCSSVSLLQYCKEKLKLYVYKTAIQHTTGSNAVPEPWKKPEVYQMFGTTSPRNLSASGGFLRHFTNTETHSFLTNPSTPYQYFAIQYQGGCFELYGVTISYSVCLQFVLPTSLVQLPRTVPPADGSRVQVPGLCSENAQPIANNVALYGHCQGNGEWSSDAASGKCWCKAGYGKYLNGNGAACKDCPQGTFQDTPSGNACKACPLNSIQDANKMKCDCVPSFYRKKDETIFDNCTAQPSAPQDFRATFMNATTVVVQWTTPSNLGGRSDVYYELECQKCDDEGKNCIFKCGTAKITHSPSNSRKATIKYLSAHTYYQFKVLAKNGVTHLAERTGDNPKYAVITDRTSESVPGKPVLKITYISSTSVLLSWTLKEKNGEITYYQIIYYPIEEKSNKYHFNTTHNSITITGLTKETEYYFEVRAATKHGLGSVGSKQIPISEGKSGADKRTAAIVTVLGLLIGVALLAVVTLSIFFILKRRRLRPPEEIERRRSPQVVRTYDHAVILDDESDEDTDQAVTLDNHFGEATDGQTEEATDQAVIPVQYSEEGANQVSQETINVLNVFGLRETFMEVPKRNLRTIQKIGEGNFACVDKATAIGLQGCNGKVTVAVKTLKYNADEINKKDFENELQLMLRMEPHTFIVKLLGCCTTSDGPMCIILEYLPYGDLLGYLRRSRGHENTHCSGELRQERSTLSSQDLLKFARMIANGMCFLAENGYVHRDLAARNVLVGENKICKISDFGLARKIRGGIYMRSTVNAMLPTKWTAPESIFTSTESTIASDVWSYGIVLWEIFTLGDVPYPKINTQDKLRRMLEEGYRMPKPHHLSETLYTLMLKCWKYKPEDRPSFTMICDELYTLYNDTNDYINIDAFEVAIYSNFDVLSR